MSEFESNLDLLNTCLASSNIPLLASRGMGPRWRGRVVLDGALVHNPPYFTDAVRRQLVVDLSHVVYPLLLTLAATDSCIEALILRGALEMR